MEWIIEPKTQALISPSLARNFRVLPLGESNGGVDLLMGRRLTDDERQKQKSVLEFYLGRPVNLQTLEERPDAEGGFDEILDHYYGTPFPDMLSMPVARQVATVLLLDPNSTRREQNNQLLVAHGFVVVAVAGVEEALARLQASGCDITEVLLPPTPLTAESEVRRRLSAVASVRISRVDEALELCDCDSKPDKLGAATSRVAFEAWGDET